MLCHTTKSTTLEVWFLGNTEIPSEILVTVVNHVINASDTYSYIISSFIKFFQESYLKNKSPLYSTFFNFFHKTFSCKTKSVRSYINIMYKHSHYTILR